VSEDVTTADFAQKDAFSRIIQKSDIVLGCIIVAPQQVAQHVVLKVGRTAINQPGAQPEVQPVGQPGEHD
jgi:hypothetical protein